MNRRKRKKRYKLTSPVPILIAIGFLAVLTLLLSLLVRSCVCGREPTQPEPTPSPSPVPTAVPTPEPSATPQPSWDDLRLIEIEGYVRAYGNCPDEEAIAARMATMVVDPERKMVAFTFDDGPNTTYTDPILDVCEQYGVRATFFLIGKNIRKGDAQIKRMLSLGCEIGNHTWNHVNVEELTGEQMREQIGSVNDALMEQYGYAVHLFRPPYIKYGDKGSDTRETLVALMREWDMAIVNHTRSTHDTYDTYTADRIYERCTLETDELGKGLDGSILLCHDKSARTAEAFARAVPELLSRGYQLVTVSELLHYSDDGFHAGWIYASAN